jgi:hypothetical protein
MGSVSSAGRRETYEETFDDGPGGWCAWLRHGVNAPLEIKDGVVTVRTPLGVDSHHAPNYLSLLAYLYTMRGMGGPLGEPNRFVDGGFSRDLTNATMTVRMRGDMRLRGTEVVLLAQADVPGTRANFVLFAQPFHVTPDWSDQSMVLAPDRNQWRCVGTRHDMAHQYGYGDIVEALKDVNVDLILVLYPVTIVPLEPTDDIHSTRPLIDYPIDERYLPSGEIQIDTIRIEYPD